MEYIINIIANCIYKKGVHGTMKKIFVLFLSFLLTVITLAACSPKQDEKMYEETEMKMDTVMTIKAYGDGAEQAVKDAFKRIDEIEQLTSITVDTSDVNKINAAAGREYIPVHTEVFEIIKKSLEYSRLSDGSFDITVGPIVKLWNFGTSEARIPSPDEIKSKLPLVGYEKVKMNEADNSVMLEKEGMSIDLGGIAKGYAADEAADILNEQGIKRAIINLGGSNVVVIGSKTEKDPWSIGIQHPRKEQGAGFLAVVKDTDKAIATSGDYERYFISDGKRYHHILDPKTGYPADTGIISDSIILDSKTIKNSSMDGDALSTAVFVLGPEKGLKLIEDTEVVEGIIATSDEKLIMSSNIKDKIFSISEEFK